MRLIKFKDETYGIKKFDWNILTNLYFDFETKSFWLPEYSLFFDDCKTDEQTAKLKLLELK